ncbi:MAG: signal peptidase I [Candidatus Niyogibacteria bacterium]|nr:signal peptidase I [Candidatus Niyogibacteria bacterium]
MRSKFWSGVWEIAKFGIIVLAIVMPIRLYIAQPFIVSGESMAPTFSSGDYLIIDELTYNFIREPQKDDVIVFRYPLDPSKFFIKRIVGLPGEELVVDGKEWQMGNDEYFVMGDNNIFSLDSRSWGPLPRENITGRALLRLWPATTFAYMPGQRQLASPMEQ